MLKSFTIDDDLSIQFTGAIEVTVEFEDGQRRWCYFMTPEALATCGDWIDGTQIRSYYGSSHMIVVSRLLDVDVSGSSATGISNALHGIVLTNFVTTCSPSASIYCAQGITGLFFS